MFKANIFQQRATRNQWGGQLQNKGQLQNNCVNDALLITINHVITLVIYSTCGTHELPGMKPGWHSVVSFAWTSFQWSHTLISQTLCLRLEDWWLGDSFWLSFCFPFNDMYFLLSRKKPSFKSIIKSNSTEVL